MEESRMRMHGAFRRGGREVARGKLEEAMPDENVVVVVCDSASAAQGAIRGLFRSGLNDQRVSVAAREGSDMAAVAYYQHGNVTEYRGRLETFWRAVWEVLPERMLLAAGGASPILVAGPLARWIIAGLDNAAIFGGLDAVAAGFYSIGIPREKIAEYEAALHDGRFLVMAHGPAAQVARARAFLTAAPGTAPGEPAE
jgi:hypothetical protein